jgi:hypothetical protein
MFTTEDFLAVIGPELDKRIKSHIAELRSEARSPDRTLDSIAFKSGRMEELFEVRDLISRVLKKWEESNE